MKVSLIAPLLGFIFVGLKLIFHIDVPEDIQHRFVSFSEEAVALAAIGYGIFKNHFKK